MFKHTFQKEAYLHIKQVFNCIFFSSLEWRISFSIVFWKKANERKKYKGIFFHGAFIYYDLGLAKLCLWRELGVGYFGSPLGCSIGFGWLEWGVNFFLTTEGGVKKYFADISADFRPFIPGSRSPLLREAPLSLFYLLCRNQSPPRRTCQQPLTSLMIQCWSGCVVCAANGSQRSVLSSL